MPSYREIMQHALDGLQYKTGIQLNLLDTSAERPLVIHLSWDETPIALTHLPVVDDDRLIISSDTNNIKLDVDGLRYLMQINHQAIINTHFVLAWMKLMLLLFSHSMPASKT